MSSWAEITALLYRYAELRDQGDHPAAAELFAHGKVRSGGQVIDHHQLLARWGRNVIVYPDGPRTKHVMTNPIIEIDEAAGTATCRSCYLTLQAGPGFALQPIVAGSYHDRFERVDGKWRFAFRDFRSPELRGDMSHHTPPHT